MIYLMRHGKDDERYVGGYSDVDLTREGQRQVLDSALWLKKNDVDVTRIYSSDVRRAVSSANIVSCILHKKVIIDSNLRELDKGILNGMLVKKALVDYPEYFNDVKVETVYPEGESMIMFYKRVVKWLDKIKDYDDSLIVTHRGFINMIYFYLNGRELLMDKEQFDVTHASIHMLDINKKKIGRIK